MEILKESTDKFIEWIKLKIRLHANGKTLYFKEGQIWWVNFGQNIGREINGKHANFERPAIVLKKFGGETFWALPVSSVPKEGRYYYRFINPGGRQNFVNLSQLRLMSSQRMIRKIGRLNEIDSNAIKDLIKSYI
jgi:mRNA interferase MazF